MKYLSSRVIKALLSVSLIVIGGIANVTSASAMPASTDDGVICINYTVYYAVCRHTITDTQTGKKEVRETKPSIPPYTTDAEGKKSAVDACIAEGVKIRAELDKKEGGLGKSKPRYTIDNFVVRAVTEHRKICIPKWLLNWFTAPKTCAAPADDADLFAATDSFTSGAGSYCSADSEFDPSLLTSDEIDSLEAQGATDELVSSSASEINTPAGSN